MKFIKAIVLSAVMALPGVAMADYTQFYKDGVDVVILTRT